MAVALENLRGRGCRLEPELEARDPLDLGVGRRVRPDGAGELADSQPLDRAGEALPVATERERPADELETERRRLRVDAVRSPDAEGHPMLLGASDNGSQGPFQACEHKQAGLLDGDRERRVEHVRRREAVVEPAPLGPQCLGDGIDERRNVVVCLTLDLRDAHG